MASSPTGFPPERELIAQYEVSRHTLREVMRKLHTEGLIDRERGRGTFMRQQPIEQRAGALYSLFRSIEEQGFEQRSKVLTLDNAATPTWPSGLASPPTPRSSTCTGCATPIPCRSPSMSCGCQSSSPSRCSQSTSSTPRSTPSSNGCVESDPAPAGNASTRFCRVVKNAPCSTSVLVNQRSSCERCTSFRTQPLEWRRTVIRGDLYTFLVQLDRHRHAERTSIVHTDRVLTSIGCRAPTRLNLP